MNFLQKMLLAQIASNAATYGDNWFVSKTTFDKNINWGVIKTLAAVDLLNCFNPDIRKEPIDFNMETFIQKLVVYTQSVNNMLLLHALSLTVDKLTNAGVDVNELTSNNLLISCLEEAAAIPTYQDMLDLRGDALETFYPERADEIDTYFIEVINGIITEPDELGHFYHLVFMVEKTYGYTYDMLYTTVLETISEYTQIPVEVITENQILTGDDNG